jgi:hypothetical protein
MRGSSKTTLMERLGQTRVAALLSKPFSLWLLRFKVAEVLASREWQNAVQMRHD